MTSNNIKIVSGDIFRYTEGVLVIPRATTGSINDSFERGLISLGIEYSPASSSLGSIDIQWNPSKRSADLHLAFATSVNNNASDYSAIATLALSLKEKLKDRGVRNIYCPLLGTGAGNLDPFFSLVYLTLPFFEEEVYNFHIVINDDAVFEKLNKFSLDRYPLVRAAIQGVYNQIKKDSSIKEVAKSKEFFFEIAQQRLNKLRSFSLNVDQKNDVLSKFNKFEGNFQEFINSHPANTLIAEYLILIGEIITYLDTKAYNRGEWNKYSDKRAIARAGVRQNDWVKNLILYSIEDNTSRLPNNIKNAINYLLQPSIELPILSERDKTNVIRTLGSYDLNERSINQLLREYFEGIESTRPINEINWGVIIVRTLYSPLVKLLWDPDSKMVKIKRQREKGNATDEVKGSDRADSEVNDDQKDDDQLDYNRTKIRAKTYKARLHDDRYAEVDLLNYELYAQTIVNFIKHEDTQAPLTIGIYAPWGMGKTTLMKFIQAKLNETKPTTSLTNEVKRTIWVKMTSVINAIALWINNKLNWKINAVEINDNRNLTVSEIIDELRSRPFSKMHLINYQYPAVWFNAWKYDNTEQILSGLAYEIVNQLVERLPNPIERERFYFNLNRKRFDMQKLQDDIRSKIYQAIFNWFSIAMVFVSATIAVIAWYLFTNAAAPWWLWLTGWGSVLGAVITSISKYVRENSRAAFTYLNKFVSQPKYEDKLGYFHQVEDDLKKVFDCLVDKHNPCVIFIDDLDRCSSKKVVEVIEAINLFINGDFPHCYFIIGMDAQMVAASIEACYSDVDKRLSGLQKTHGSLGWYFMEKFVQLQFAIPNLSNESGRMFLKKLLEDSIEQEHSTDNTINELKQKVQSIDLTDKQSVSELSEKLDGVSQTHMADVKDIKSALIDRAAKELKDSDGDAVELLENYAHYLNVSPRVIKRFANLFRFYRFMQIPNLTNRLNDLQEHEIAQMVILSLRWPQLPRLIQWNTAAELIEGSNALERAAFLDERFLDNWSKLKPGEPHQWLLDEGLKSFISTNKINLKRYVEVGVW